MLPYQFALVGTYELWKAATDEKDQDDRYFTSTNSARCSQLSGQFFGGSDLGLIHSREYPKNHSREYRKNHKSLPGIPGNGNENFFLRKKKPIFYVLQRFTLSFHV